MGPERPVMLNTREKITLVMLNTREKTENK